MSVRFQVLLAACVTAAAILLSTGAASAATVVNGDFESGTLAGWQLANYPPAPEESGTWLAYSAAEVSPEIPPPPAGTWAAITFQGGPGVHILYQDVALEPGYSHELSAVVYYQSWAPPVTPDPETFETGTELEPTAPNQQYRVDVMKPTAPIDSINPDDILASVFATKSGDPEELGPTTVKADLSRFAGQTVRLRMTEVDNQGEFRAGLDSVAIASAPLPLPPPPPPSNLFSFGKPTFNKKKGTARLPITFPGAGTVQFEDARKDKKQIKATVLRPSAAGTLQLVVKPNKKGRKTLLAKGKLPVKLAVTFTPSLGTAATQTRKLVLKQPS